MTASKLTEPQLRALREIVAGHVSYSSLTLSWWNHRTHRYMHKTTMNSLCFAGLIHDRGVYTELTDRGRKVLASTWKQRCASTSPHGERCDLPGHPGLHEHDNGPLGPGESRHNISSWSEFSASGETQRLIEIVIGPCTREETDEAVIQIQELVDRHLPKLAAAVGAKYNLTISRGDSER